ncbi:hypothetical protein ACFY9A_29080 [Streptomyces rubradiris]|uniref:hypothetical protein n=1 Tax=Streptomyces rubradiris TaxID=285531 RepID=UPI0036EEF838
MAQSPQVRLVIDSVDFTGEYENVEIATPRERHLIPDGSEAPLYVLGPAGFTILISRPSDRLYAFVASGYTTRDVKVTVNGLSITHPTHFHKGWVGTDGIRKMFGSLAIDYEREAKWVQELPAGASTATEGN